MTRTTDPTRIRLARLESLSVYYALTDSQQIALHRNMDRLFRTPAEVGDEALGEAFAEPLRQSRGAFAYTLDGQRITTIFQRSPLIGWHFFLAR